MKELMPGMRIWKNPKNKFVVLRIHYTADKDKRTKGWLEEAKQGMPNMEWEREMEINFAQSRSKRLYPDYSENTHFKELTINPYLPVLCCWDFGFVHPAFAITQVDEDGRWYILYELLGTEIQLEKFVPLCLKIVPKVIRVEDSEGNKEDVELTFKHWCDPAGSQRSDKNIRTSIEILKSFNIHPIYKKSNPAERARIIRSKVMIQQDGLPGLLVSHRCPIINQGFMGGFHFKENPTPGKEDEPDKDGYYDHFNDCLGYLAHGVFKPKNQDPNHRTRVRRAPRQYHKTLGII